MKEEIDLVIPWVDGADPSWRKQRKHYESEDEKKNNTNSFYRDWGLMRYWFRGVERNLPWIHKIYFVTWGHTPPWLNGTHPKLSIVKHEDYIPSEFRPTFSTNPIELNQHRIKGLSEQFIYANDDTFLLVDLNQTITLKMDSHVIAYACALLQNPVQMGLGIYCGTISPVSIDIFH
ncbi:MAG: Stealth CR1 domain-containing protein [Lachnospiraceae bacterium]|nr:Stealth CR1 domain-containing protein [Lachnospiraceae bacterium]